LKTCPSAEIDFALHLDTLNKGWMEVVQKKGFFAQNDQQTARTLSTRNKRPSAARAGSARVDGQFGRALGACCDVGLRWFAVLGPIPRSEAKDAVSARLSVYHASSSADAEAEPLVAVVVRMSRNGGEDWEC